MPVTERKTKHPFISIDRKISGGQTVISGTCIKVMDIALRYEFMGMSADEIINEYPHLKLEQIHDSLFYYYEHKDAIDKKFSQDQTLLNKLKEQFPSKLKANLR